MLGKKIGLFALALIACTTIIGCGDKPPTPYEKYKMAQLEKEALTTLRVQGMLLDQNGKPVSDMKVSVSSGRFEEDAYTASDGHFSVMTKFENDDVLDFRFENAKVEWTESLGFIPKGIEKLTLRFRMDDMGKVRLAAYEY